jgi:hypothetical protein
MKVKTSWQRNILSINLFNEIAVGSDDSIDPGPESLAGLRHGVPGEEPHYLPDVMDQVSGFFGGFAFILNSETLPAKESKGLNSGELGARIFFYHASHEVLLEPNRRPLAVVGRVAVYAGRCNGYFQISDPSSTPSSHSCSGYVQTSTYHRKKPFLTEVSIAHNHFHGMSGAKSGDCPCSYGFQLVHLCRNVSVCFYL